MTNRMTRWMQSTIQMPQRHVHIAGTKMPPELLFAFFVAKQSIVRVNARPVIQRFLQKHDFAQSVDEKLV